MNPNLIAVFAFILLVLVPMLIYLVFYLQTSSIIKERNRKSKFLSFDTIKSFNMTVNAKTQRIDLIYRLDKLSSNALTFSEFKNQLDQDNFKLFDDWINEILKRKEPNKNITLYFKPSRTYRGFFARLSFLSVDKKNGIVYVSGLRSAREITKVLKGTKIIGASAFKDKVNELKPSQGVMIVLNFNLFDLINRRYDKEVATRYIKALWTTIIAKSNDPNLIIGIYRGDSIAMFNKNITNNREAINFIENQVKKFGQIITFDNYTFDINPFIGFTMFKEVTTSFEILIKHAYKAAESARINNLQITNYDTDLELGDSDNQQQLNDIKRMVEQRIVNPIFVPITSLINGKIFGVFAKLNFAFTNIKNFNIAFQVAKENDFEKEFVELVITQWFDEFIKNYTSFKKLLIFLDTRQLEVVIKLLSAHPRYRKVSLVLIITDYENIIKNKTNLSEINSLFESKVSLGIVANSSMQTIIHPILSKFEFLVWPSKIVKDVLKDEKSKFVVDNIIQATEVFSLRSIAWEIKSYEQGEFLKGKGVLLMAGPLFNSDTTDINSGYSVRKVQKLIG
jgi:EAL domain-containing protein (putative c-di-GMP-specific phosphodiesterase class I)